MNAPLFDYMFSADIFVDDMRHQSDLLVKHLGLHPPSPRAIVTDSPEAHATMFRLQRALADAPTRLEVIQPAQASGHWNCAHIQQAWAAQKNRAVRFHNTVVVCDTEALVDALRRRGIPHIVDRSVSFVRVWVGITAERNDVYDARWDAGLRLEFLSFKDFPVGPPAQAGMPANVTLERVSGRSFIVDDLDACIRTLDATLAWQPEQPVRRLAVDGVLRAVYTFRHERSARLELLQVERDGTPAARFAAAHGAGPYTLALRTADLLQWEQDLRASGITPFRPADDELYGQRLVIEPGPVGPVRIELVSGAD